MFGLSSLRQFSFILAVKYVQQLEEISKSSKYCLGYILKEQKVLNDRMKLESDAILKIQHSGGTGASSCVRYLIYCRAIPKRDLSTKKTIPNIEM